MTREDVIRDISDRFQRSGLAMNERQRRLWAAAEAIKLPRGGIALVSKALRISPNTIRKGIREIAADQAYSASGLSMRIRKPGGGRKPKEFSSDSPALQ